MSLVEFAAVAAYLLQSHEELSADVAHVGIRSGILDPTGVDIQLRGRLDDAVLSLARWAGAVGAGQVELRPEAGYVRARVCREVSTPAGMAQVEVWTHLDVWTAQRVASRFEVTLAQDSGPVLFEVAHVLRVLGAVA